MKTIQTKQNRQNLNILLGIPLYMDIPKFVNVSANGYMSFQDIAV